MKTWFCVCAQSLHSIVRISICNCSCLCACVSISRSVRCSRVWLAFNVCTSLATRFGRQNQKKKHTHTTKMQQHKRSIETRENYNSSLFVAVNSVFRSFCSFSPLYARFSAAFFLLSLRSPRLCFVHVLWSFVLAWTLDSASAQIQNGRHILEHVSATKHVNIAQSFWYYAFVFGFYGCLFVFVSHLSQNLHFAGGAKKLNFTRFWRLMSIIFEIDLKRTFWSAQYGHIPIISVWIKFTQFQCTYMFAYAYYDQFGKIFHANVHTIGPSKCSGFELEGFNFVYLTNV